MSTLVAVPSPSQIRAQRTPVWLWPNLLCLDAPLVAIVWQEFLAHCFSIPLRAPARWMLGFTVWAIYLGDRLLDVRLAPRGRDCGPHQFCREHGVFAMALFGTALAADFVGLIWLRRAVLWSGFLVFAAVASYFAAFPMRRVAGFAKPMAAAVLFAVGVFLVAWTRGTSAALALPAAAFAALCLANLLLIDSWERRRSTARLRLWIGILAGVSFLFAASPWYAAVGLGAAGLCGLAVTEAHLDRDVRRVLADAVLLSPLVIWTLAR